jgi:hypothetical protein
MAATTAAVAEQQAAERVQTAEERMAAWEGSLSSIRSHIESQATEWTATKAEIQAQREALTALQADLSSLRKPLPEQPLQESPKPPSGAEEGAEAPAEPAPKRRRAHRWM